jgi:hypothetical protein
VRDALALGGDGGSELAVLWEHLRQQAHMAAYQDTFLILCGVTLLAMAPACLARERRSRTG